MYLLNTSTFLQTNRAHFVPSLASFILDTARFAWTELVSVITTTLNNDIGLYIEFLH